MVKINGLPFISPAVYSIKVDYHITGSSAFELTIPIGVTRIDITLIGGGGAGGASKSTYEVGGGGGSGYIQHYTLRRKEKEFSAGDTFINHFIGSGGASIAPGNWNATQNGGTTKISLKHTDGSITTYSVDGGAGGNRRYTVVQNEGIYIGIGGNGGFGGGGSGARWFNTIGTCFGGYGGCGGTMENKTLTSGTNYFIYNFPNAMTGQDSFGGGGAVDQGKPLQTDGSTVVYYGDGRAYHGITDRAKNEQYKTGGRVTNRAACCFFNDIDSGFYLGPGGNGGRSNIYWFGTTEGEIDMPGGYGGGYYDENWNNSPPKGTAYGGGGNGGHYVSNDWNDWNSSAGGNGAIGIRFYYG